MSVKFKDVNVDKVIGRGMLGTINLAHDKKGNKYAIKTVNILRSDINESLKFPLWRELEFITTMNKLYPDQFVKLYDHKIIYNCKHNQSWENVKHSILKDANKNFYKNVLFKSGLCSMKLYSYVEGTLYDLINTNKLDQEVINDLFKQVLYIIYLINKEGYIHDDLHSLNIGFVTTKNKNIKILNKNVNTHGILLQAIDFGTVKHKKYILKERELEVIDWKNDLYMLLNRVVFNFYDFFNKYKDIEFNSFNDYILKDDEIEKLKEYIKIPKSLKNNTLAINHLYKYLYKYVFYERYEKFLYPKCEIIKPTLLIPFDDIIYIFNNIDNVEKVLKHLI